MKWKLWILSCFLQKCNLSGNQGHDSSNNLTLNGLVQLNILAFADKAFICSSSLISFLSDFLWKLFRYKYKFLFESGFPLDPVTTCRMKRQNSLCQQKYNWHQLCCNAMGEIGNECHIVQKWFNETFCFF